MIARVKTFAFRGVDVIDVDVQVAMTSGLPSFTIVGLPDKAVAESKERVRSALTAIGLGLPPKRITVNLAPADIAKEGSHYDLTIAIGLLIATGVLVPEDLINYVVLGELALDGSTTRSNGILPAAVGASARGLGIICPAACANEAIWAGEIPILPATDLLALINHFKGTQLISQPTSPKIATTKCYPDLKDIKGQKAARRALEIAASGGHHLLMIGPPGSGKSMLAARLSGIVPPLTAREMLESSMITSIAGMISPQGLETTRPFRDPHHSCSVPAMVGGGSKAKPGEVSLAHNGILFLDELAEFPRIVLDSLRQPIETGQITIARANSHITYPANFQLIAAMNPCRCGYLADPARACSRAPKCGEDYQNKISGPLFDRIDIAITIQPVEYKSLQCEEVAEDTITVAKRVFAARKIQQQRYHGTGITVNAEASGELLSLYTKLSQECNEILEQAMMKLGLSMRGVDRILRTARTIADMRESENIERTHLLEAVSYRRALAR